MTLRLYGKKATNDDTDDEDNEDAEENSYHEEYHVQTREEFQETPPLDRGKRPASTSTKTTTTGKKRGQPHLLAGAEPPLLAARSLPMAEGADDVAGTFFSRKIDIIFFQ